MWAYIYKGGNPSPSLRGFEHLTASYLNTPFHRHRQALRHIRHLHWHPLARSRVSRLGMQWWPNLRTSHSFTTHLYPNSRWALQHTAPHCNTLQHMAAYCNKLQHTATHCNRLQHTATHCNMKHTVKLTWSSPIWFMLIFCTCCVFTLAHH